MTFFFMPSLEIENKYECNILYMPCCMHRAYAWLYISNNLLDLLLLYMYGVQLLSSDYCSNFVIKLILKIRKVQLGQVVNFSDCNN